MQEPQVEFLDRVGISASILCVLHCLATPFLVMSLPLLGHWVNNFWFHIAMAIFIFPVAIVALFNGYKIHKRAYILALGGIGLGFIGAGLLTQNHHHHHGPNQSFLFTALGGAFLVSAHLLNLRTCKKCKIKGTR